MAKAKTENKEEKKYSKMYLGPTIGKYGLQNGSVIIGDVKTLYGSAIKEIPELEELFVNLDKDLALKKGAIFQKGTNENFYYSKVIEKLTGGK